MNNHRHAYAHNQRKQKDEWKWIPTAAQNKCITLSKRNVNSVNGFKKTVETMGYIIIEYIKQIEKQ